MKKIFLLFSFVAFATATVQAQTKTKKGGWGFKIGANGSNLRVEDGENTDWKTGLAAGLFFTVNTGGALSIQPEFLYSSMGGKEVPNTLGLTDGSVPGSSLRLNYFSMPVLLKWKAGPVAIVAGPQLDILIKSNFKNSGGNFTATTENYTEASFNGTAGLEVWPLHCLGLTARYIYGFSNVNPEETIGLSVRPQLYNQGVQLTLGLKL